jgi:hypothetical protein
VPGERSLAAGRRGSGREDDGLGGARWRGQQPLTSGQVKTRGDKRDRRQRRASRAELGPDLTLLHGPVAFGPGRAGADEDEVGDAAQHAEHHPVSRPGQPAGAAAQRDGAVSAGDHIGPHPTATTPVGRVLVGLVPVEGGDFGNGAGERARACPRGDLQIGSAGRVDLAHGQQSIR